MESLTRVKKILYLRYKITDSAFKPVILYLFEAHSTLARMLGR